MLCKKMVSWHTSAPGLFAGLCLRFISKKSAIGRARYGTPQVRKGTNASVTGVRHVQFSVSEALRLRGLLHLTQTLRATGGGGCTLKRYPISDPMKENAHLKLKKRSAIPCMAQGLQRTKKKKKTILNANDVRTVFPQ